MGVVCITKVTEIQSGWVGAECIPRRPGRGQLKWVGVGWTLRRLAAPAREAHRIAVGG